PAGEHGREASAPRFFRDQRARVSVRPVEEPASARHEASISNRATPRSDAPDARQALESPAATPYDGRSHELLDGTDGDPRELRAGAPRGRAGAGSRQARSADRGSVSGGRPLR